MENGVVSRIRQYGILARRSEMRVKSRTILTEASLSRFIHMCDLHTCAHTDTYTYKHAQSISLTNEHLFEDKVFVRICMI